MECGGLCEIEANINLRIQMEERLKIAYYYNLKYMMKHVFN